MTDPDISDLTAEYLGRHDDQRIIGQLLSLVLRGVCTGCFTGILLVGKNEADFEVLLEKIQNVFCEKLAIFLLPQKGTIGWIVVVEMHFPVDLLYRIGPLKILGHPYFVALYILDKFEPVAADIALMGANFDGFLGSWRGEGDWFWQCRIVLRYFFLNGWDDLGCCRTKHLAEFLLKFFHSPRQLAVAAAKRSLASPEMISLVGGPEWGVGLAWRPELPGPVLMNSSR